MITHYQLQNITNIYSNQRTKISNFLNKLERSLIFMITFMNMMPSQFLVLWKIRRRHNIFGYFLIMIMWLPWRILPFVQYFVLETPGFITDICPGYRINFPQSLKQTWWMKTRYHWWRILLKFGKLVETDLDGIWKNILVSQ